MRSHPPTALILGLTGGYGAAMARALARDGHTLRALVRDPARGRRAAAALGLDVTLVAGDLLDAGALARAAEGARVVVHGVNAPYHRWDPLVPRFARAVAGAAARAGATILFPGNVYGLAPGVGLTEETPPRPPTKKGRLRVEAEAILTGATTRGARLIVLRGGDFFGAGGASTWSRHLLRRALRGGPIAYPGPLAVPHQWAFLPDYAAAHAALLRLPGLPPAATFHFEGHAVTGDAWVAAARAALGDPARPVKPLPWRLYRAAGLAVPLLRELGALRYLWEQPLLMDGARLRDALGDTLPATPLPDALAAEITALRRDAPRAAAA